VEVRIGVAIGVELLPAGMGDQGLVHPFNEGCQISRALARLREGFVKPDISNSSEI
jgi:hypothetical protein